VSLSKKTSKIIFFTGGVISSLGKGLSSASLAMLFKKRGLKVSLLKMDPYLNVDPGTMSPFQHGEVFVTEDGAETDLDLGHYERFTDINVGKENNITAGKIYEEVLSQERKGVYLGKTVQVIPHITDAIKNKILKLAKKNDICLVEIGGTVGDIESLPFLEAARQLRFDLSEHSVQYIHVTLVPYIKAADELKTKPTQHSVQELRRIGIQPDFLICRSDRKLPKEIKDKISLFSNVHNDFVIEAPDVNSIYELPILFHEQKFDLKILKKQKIKTPQATLSSWKSFLKKKNAAKKEIHIGIIGKYVDLKESYKSLHEALEHASIHNDARLNVHYLDSKKLESASLKSLEKRNSFFKSVDALLIPGGFGDRGSLGKIRAIEWARVNKFPCFGICLGMQLMALEYAQNELQIKNANSEEFCKKKSSTSAHIIHYLPGQKQAEKGGSMRLGAYECTLSKKSLAYKSYKKTKISERHRHRLEFNNKYRKDFAKSDMMITGENKKNKLVEIVELKKHPWFLGCQFHPEFKSRPEKSHPLFMSFIQAGLKNKKT